MKLMIYEILCNPKLWLLPAKFDKELDMDINILIKSLKLVNIFEGDINGTAIQLSLFPKSYGVVCIRHGVFDNVIYTRNVRCSRSTILKLRARHLQLLKGEEINDLRNA